MILAGTKINVLGDSITEGCAATDINLTYWKRLEADGAIVRAYGVGGTRIARQQIPSDDPKMDRFFQSRIGEMDSDVDVIVVFGGTNDYGHGDAPFGTMNDRTPDTFYGALHLLYCELIDKFPFTEILVMTPIHYQFEHNTINGLGHKSAGCLEEYVDKIIEVANYYAIPVLDLYRLSGIQPENTILRERYCPDGLHPNDAGHERIYRLLRNYLLYKM